MEHHAVRSRDVDDEKGGCQTEASEMWIWRRMERIIWTGHRTNEEVLKKVEEKRSF